MFLFEDERIPSGLVRRRGDWEDWEGDERRGSIMVAKRQTVFLEQNATFASVNIMMIAIHLRLVFV